MQRDFFTGLLKAIQSGGGVIYLRTEEAAASPEEGETIFTSYPKDTPDEVEKAAMEYFIQLNK